MRRHIICAIIIIMTSLNTSVTWGEQEGIQGDPFSPSNRKAASAPSSQDALGTDPFRNPFTQRMPEKSSPQRGPRTRNLTGIILSEKSGIAIVGGDTFRKNEMIGDRKLVKISRNSIVLMDKSGRSEKIFLENYGMRR